MTENKNIMMAYVSPSASGKTDIYDVVNRHTGGTIGQIRWFGRFRKYCFFPSHDMVFDASCLSVIAEWLRELKK